MRRFPRVKNFFKTLFLILILGAVLYFLGTTVYKSFQVEEHKVTFKLNNGKRDVVVSVKDGNVVRKIDDPKMEGFTFVEWTLDGKTYNFNSDVKNDFVLEAVWKDNETGEILSNVAIYTITFDTAGGTEIPEQAVKEGDKIVRPEDPSRFGYVFLAWELDGKTYDFHTPVKENVTLVALWKEER